MKIPFVFHISCRTSTFDGLALAGAAAVHIAERLRGYTLFATHCFELTALAEQLDCVHNVHLDASEHGEHITGAPPSPTATRMCPQR